MPLDIIELPSHGEVLTDQVLVFQYKGKLHAIDHVSVLDGSGSVTQADFVVLSSFVVSPVEWDAV